MSRNYMSLNYMSQNYMKCYWALSKYQSIYPLIYQRGLQGGGIGGGQPLILGGGADPPDLFAQPLLKLHPPPLPDFWYASFKIKIS